MHRAKHTLTWLFTVVTLVAGGVFVAPDADAGPINGVWDLADDYSNPPGGLNPHPDRFGNADVWRYITASGETHDPAQYSTAATFFGGGVGIHYYSGAGDGSISFNKTGSDQTAPPGGPTQFVPNGEAFGHPGVSQLAGVEWTAPVTTTVTFSGSVIDRDGGNGDGVAWSIDKGATTLASGSIDNGAGVTQLFSAGTGASSLVDVPVVAGDKFYLMIENRAEFFNDLTQLNFTVTPKDTDTDGIADVSDLCPGTPSGQAVGPDGCPLQLTVVKRGKGKVTSTDGLIRCGRDCSQVYTSVTSVTLKAKAKPGYVFKKWTGACTGKRKKCVVQMTQAKRVTAKFARIA